MLQFPLRPVYADCPNITAAKFKPNHKCVELEVPYDTSIFSADNYDNRPSHQKLVSSEMDQKTCLSVAVIRDGELHVTPLQNVLQIKPSFDNIKTREVTEEMSDDEDDDKKAPIQQVSVQLV
jgi:DNA-directed RNA polymerase III subunit RPC5